MKKNGQLYLAVDFMILMMALGASDSLRGIFAPAFQTHFNLNAVGLSIVIVVSYLGNLCFLYFGGGFLDRYDRKKVTMGVMTIWMTSLIIYLLTDHYIFLLMGMFLAMGTSTLLNTTLNILTPLIFTSSPGMMVNILFFVQGIGTSVSQNVAGRWAQNYTAFKIIICILLLLGGVSLFLFWRSEFIYSRNNSQEEKTAVSYSVIVKQQGFLMLVIIFGFYFIAEHGIMNWLVSYGTNQLGLETAHMAVYLSGFYGTMTVGRLLFSPVITKIGSFRSIEWLGGIGTLLFVLGILLKEKGLFLLSISGLSISVVYPTLVYLTRYIFPENMLGAALGAVISYATLFDIGFNVLLGKMIDVAGYTNSFRVIAMGMLCFYGCFQIFSKKYRGREKAKYTISFLKKQK